MLLTIHDASLRKVAFIDNNKQATLNYFNDSWTRYLETGSSTFDFTVFKKAIISDIGRKRAYNYLNEKAFVSFQYKGKTYLHTIRKIEENEQIIKCYGINLNLELINEYANPYKSPKAMTFKEYCDAMDLLNFTFLKIGVNEVSTQKISAEWEGADTKLNRLLSLAKKFGAEIEFDIHLNADSSIKSFVVNVYHEHDDNNQGVGRVRPTILKYGKNLKTLTRTVDKTNIYNMVRPTGRTEDGKTVTISGLGSWSVKNSKGEREFYQAGEGLYAPISMQMYPSVFTSSTTNDQWIRKDMQVESANPEVIRSAAYRELKKNCYPAVTYEAEGFADLEIGDTVQVYDDGFSPVLLLEMRVSEQTISFTNPKNNKTTFSNAKALENRLSGGIQQRIDQMIEDAKPYIIKLATDNGVGFKNGQGQSVVTPTLMKGNKVIDSGWRWVVNGIIKSTSPSYIVKASDVSQTLVVTVSAWIDNQEVASEQVTFINSIDGPAGRGIASVDTYYLLTTMSAGVTHSVAGWTKTVQIPTSNQRFVWSYRVERYTDGRATTGEPYILSIYGEKGDKGSLDEEQLNDLQGKIDSKADSQLTQEQLNALARTAQHLEKETEAMATAAEMKAVMRLYTEYRETYNTDKETAEAKLKETIERAAAIEKRLGTLAESWIFNENLMRADNNGIIFSALDGSESIQITKNRITMFSAGAEVMSISQGLLKINNGIFSESIQIGHFREEAYYVNGIDQKMNVERYFENVIGG